MPVMSTQTMHFDFKADIVLEQMLQPGLIRETVLIDGELITLDRGTILVIESLEVAAAAHNNPVVDEEEDAAAAASASSYHSSDDSDYEPPSRDDDDAAADDDMMDLNSASSSSSSDSSSSSSSEEQREHDHRAVLSAHHAYDNDAGMEEVKEEEEEEDHRRAPFPSSSSSTTTTKHCFIDLCEEEEYQEDAQQQQKRQRVSAALDDDDDNDDSPTLSLYVASGPSLPALLLQAQQSSDDDEEEEDDALGAPLLLVLVPPPPPVLQQQQPPRTCFWVAGIGHSIETGQLEQFLGGEHFLAWVAARAAAGIALEGKPPQYVDANTLAQTHPNTFHVQLEEHGGAFFAKAYFMPTILDFIVRRNADPRAPMYLRALHAKSDDAVALDTLQHFLFVGEVFRSPLVLIENDDEARYAEIALFPPLVRCHMTPAISATGKATTRRSQNDPRYLVGAMDDLAPMCVDPLWLAMVRKFKDEVNAPDITHAVLMQSPAVISCDDTSPQYCAETLSVYEARGILLKHYCPSLIDIYNFPDERDAAILRVERGVEFRISTYKLEDEPGARLDRVAGWDMGMGHRLVYRVEAEAALRAQLAVAKASTSMSVATVRRRALAQAELDAFRADTTTAWFVL